MLHRLNSSPARQRESVGSCTKKAGGAALALVESAARAFSTPNMPTSRRARRRPAAQPRGAAERAASFDAFRICGSLGGLPRNQVKKAKTVRGDDQSVSASTVWQRPQIRIRIRIIHPVPSSERSLLRVRTSGSTLAPRSLVC